MLNHPLKKLDKERLRRWLLLFFFALLIPTLILIQQSYSRLKWETFHQHQLMAAELSERIDSQLIKLIGAEDLRPMSDFSFLKAPANVKSGVIQRSPLADFPIRSEIPGVIGYFQVDASGQLETPLVPLSTPNDYGIPPIELDQRFALQNQIQTILAANQLVQKASAPTVVAEIQARERAETYEVLADQADANSIEAEASSSSGLANSAPTVTKLESFADDRMGSAFNVQQSAEQDLEEFSAPAPQQQQAPIAFDQLKESNRKSAKKADYGRVEDLQIQQNYVQKDELIERKIARQQKQQAAPKTSPASTLASETKKHRIRTFESEIDPFEFSQLDSGHFVLFRKVWRNGQRYTQGLLLEQATFLSGIIKQEYNQTNLSGMSDLLIAFQGNVLTAFSGSNARNSRYDSQQIVDKQRGEQLYQVRLSDPLSDLQLIYSITQLPIGPGGQLILWLSLVLGAILLGGFYLMYRLGVSQINLANQQQDFVSAVSHELKTPLTSIRMYGELLREGWATEDKKKTYCQFIFDESERLTRLINNVLQLARMTRNEQEAELVGRNVLELVRDIQARITSQTEAAGFTLAVNTDDTLITKQIMIDADWLTQIMINLVDNAIKFSAKAEVKHIILDVESSANQQVNFTISDHGPGIDKQQMKKIFQLFYRSEDELTRDTVGTGIGLSLVHQMTTAMGGKVSVENRGLGGEFCGAAFRVVFPVMG